MSVAPWLGAPATTLLVLLIAGHVLGDFLFQTRAMVERKADSRMLLVHSGMVLGAHSATVLPFVRWNPIDLLRAVVLLLVLGALHALVDLIKVRWKARLGGDSVRLFVADQAVHVAVILSIWHVWRSWLGVEPGRLAPVRDLSSLAAFFVVLSASSLTKRVSLAGRPTRRGRG